MVFSSDRDITHLYWPVHRPGDLFQHGYRQPGTETGLPPKLPFQIPIDNHPLWAVQRSLA
jgi:hypothetical protein